MSAARIARLTERLNLYLTAEQKVLEGNQSWSSPDGMTYTRADLRTIRAQIRDIESELDNLNGVGYQPQHIVFGGPGR